MRDPPVFVLLSGYVEWHSDEHDDTWLVVGGLML